MATSKLNKGEGKVHFNHFNGKTYFESSYKYYKLNGLTQLPMAMAVKELKAIIKMENATAFILHGIPTVKQKWKENI